MDDNYLSLINIKYKEHISLFFLPIIFIILVILSLIIETSEKYKVYYYFNNNVISVTVPIENSDKIINADYLLLDNKKYTFKVISIDYDMGNEYQTINIEANVTKIDNQIGNIVFSFNKEKIIKKIIKLFF